MSFSVYSSSSERNRSASLMPSSFFESMLRFYQRTLDVVLEAVAFQLPGLIPLLADHVVPVAEHERVPASGDPLFVRFCRAISNAHIM